MWQISYIGPDRYEPEYDPPIVEINTDKRLISYSLEGYWLDPEVQLERWVEIETVKVKSGNMISIIDIKVTIIDK